VSTPLPFEEQTALLLRLKQGLQDAKTAEHARNLLRRLRARDDLFARVADEIDQMLAVQVISPPPPAFERARPEPAARVGRDPGTAADPARHDRSSVGPAATRGRLVRLGRRLVAIDEFREYLELQRRYWALLREQPSVTTAVQWLFGDSRQLVLRFRIMLKVGLLILALGLLVALSVELIVKHV
jgi:hypothetical protein